MNISLENLIKIKQKEISKIRDELLIKQNFLCYMCSTDLSNSNTKNIHLDHDHETGLIRSVLCARCNRIQGKVEKLYNRYTPKDVKSDTDKRKFYKGLLSYLDIISTNYIHPIHKTDDEKRILRNKRARKKRKIKNENKRARKSKTINAKT